MSYMSIDSTLSIAIPAFSAAAYLPEAVEIDIGQIYMELGLEAARGIWSDREEEDHGEQ